MKEQITLKNKYTIKYFSLQVFISSPTARRLKIDNKPGKDVVGRLNLLVDNILDPLREAYGKPVIVTSGYRCPALNKAVGGVKSSQHMLGEAADIRTVSDKPEDNRRLFDLCRELKLPFDQLIDEYGYNWIHVSFSPRHHPRDEVRLSL